jgi:hypothetical protein
LITISRETAAWPCGDALAMLSDECDPINCDVSGDAMYKKLHDLKKKILFLYFKQSSAHGYSMNFITGPCLVLLLLT